MSQHHFPLGLRDWLACRMQPWLSRRWHHGGETIWHPGCWLVVGGCWLRSKFLLKAVSEALSLNGVGRATGFDAGATLGLAVVDLSGLQPNLFSFILPTTKWPRQVGHACQSVPTRALKSPSKCMPSELGIPDSVSCWAS